ncbi:filament-like plant protein 5 [Selaginella moellendorffii]|uniref:filament-like plant protein 5 n=1 Tax=Selaginella moellendorffii TaxID=88036 RepID=UPI000D1C2E43|nr:filament-like plant protein 5 [Selaginella moellendorffii]|eukprot:XP_024521064.1 filament-like plant protein 5 [Selaginella moellendorffii]
MSEAVDIPELIMSQNGDHIAKEPNGDATGDLGKNTPAMEKDQGDESVQLLTSKLTVALKEIINKDNLVKQHAKVAEDAISGWEKAEAEAAMLKQQLENAQQQRLALDERVAHLDGALKECVKQLRTGREEQEQKQEELEEKTKEWDRVRTDLDARLTEAEEQVLQATAENASLEQRLADAKVQADLDVKKVSTKVESLEKENAALKHDVRALKKDLVGLNNESKKASEAAKQQLLDSSRKVSKLEADCQRLKIQLRKKTAGSSPHLREVDVLDRRKSLGRLVSSPRAFSETVDDCSEMSNKDMDDRFALEEETKSLKDELAKRNKELQAARIMCARTAGKLLNVEEQLASIYGEQDVSKMGLNGHIEALRSFGDNQQASHGSCNGDEADAWASALITELAQFKKEDKKPDKLLDTTSFELMDDFLEMEKLTSNVPHENGQALERKESGSPSQKDLDAANEVIIALRKKVSALESQVHNNTAANGHAQGQVDGVPSRYGDVDQLANEQKKELVPLARKIFRSLERLGQDGGLEHGQKPPSDSEIKTDEITLEVQWTNADVDGSFERLAASGNALLQGNADFFSFIAEVCNTLDVLAGLERDRSPELHMEAALAAANSQIVLLREELARHQENLAALKIEKVVLMDSLHDSAGKNASVLDDLTLQNREMEEKLAASTVLVEQLKSRISVLENDLKAADVKARDQVQELSKKFEESLGREICAKETAERSLQTMNGVMAELEAQREKLDEQAKSQLMRIEVLETDLKRGRQDKLATQKDIDAVNQDIQKLMADFVQLQHEKQDLEEALAEASQQRHEDSNKTNVHLQTIDGLEEDLRRLMEQEQESRKSLEETKLALNKYLLREEALHRSLSEKEARCIEMDLCLEKHKDERTLLEQKASEQLKMERGRVSTLQEDIGRLELQNVRLEGRLCQSNEELKAQEASFISLQSEFYQLKIEKEEMEQSFSQNVQQLRTRIATLEEEGKRLKAEHADIQDGFMHDVERVKGDFNRSDKELREVSTEKERLCVEVEGLTRIVEEFKESCSKLETEVLALQRSNEDVEQKLQTATDNLKRLEAECSRLENEKMDLEHVLAATNEIVQGVKEECSRLSIAEQELKELKAEKEEIQRRANESLKQVTQDFQTLEADKAELEHDLALSQVTWKSQVFEAEELVASLRAELALSAKSRQLAEDQLAESFSAKAELQYEVKAALHAASQLEERSKALEEELGKERSKSRAAAAELDDLLQQQLSRTKNSSPVVPTPDSSTEKSVDFAAKLDECHRAILNLGEQLQSLSMSRSSQSPAAAAEEPSTSEESTNNTKLKPDEAETLAAKPAEPTPELATEGSEQNGESKVFVPSIPLEGRPRSKSTSPAKSKILKAAAAAASASKELDLTKSLDMGSPSEKPPSSAFSRFFRGKGSSSSSHHHP